MLANPAVQYQWEAVQSGAHSWSVQACAVDAEGTPKLCAWSMGQTLEGAVELALRILRQRVEREPTLH